MIVLHIHMQSEHIMEHTNGMCQMFNILKCKRKIFFNIRMASVIYVEFGQLVDHYVTRAHTLRQDTRKHA